MTTNRVAGDPRASFVLAIALVLGLASAPLAFAQNKPAPETAPVPAPPKVPPITIDLTAAESQSWAVDPGTYRVVLYNAIPGVKYSVRSGQAELAELPVLLFPAGSTIASAGLVEPPPDMKLCRAALDDVKALIVARSETDVPGLQQKIRANITGCGDAERTYIEKVLEQTVYESGLEIQVPNDARRTITVARQTVEWNVTLTTLSRGRVQTLFGWIFAPNHDEEFFTESAEDNQFTIKPRPEGKGGLTNLPSVFFTWLPTGQAFADLQHGPTLGLGVTAGATGARAAFLGGWMIRWNQNLGISFGAAFYPHRRLDGKYTPGQTIATNLESSQLNRDSWRINAYFGGVLRFGSDPRKAPPAAPAVTPPASTAKPEPKTEKP